MVREYLESHCIKHVQECPMFRKYYADFYLPKHKSVIEVYGDYWHANPRIYGEDKTPLNDQQKKYSGK